PQSLAGRRLGADLVIAIGLTEGLLGGQETRRVLVPAEIRQHRRARRPGRDRQDAAIDRVGVDAERASGRPGVVGINVELEFAVARQAPNVSPTGEEAGLPGATRRGG